MPQSAEKGRPRPPARAKVQPSSIKRRWILNSISVILVVLVFIAFLVGVFIRTYYYDSVRAELEGRAGPTAQSLWRYSASAADFTNNGRQTVGSFAEGVKMDLQILNTTGRVTAAASGLIAGSFIETEDVQVALFGAKVMHTYVGIDPLTGEKVMATTAPVINSAGTLFGAVRYVTALRELDKQLFSIYLLLAGAVVAISALTIVSNSYFIRTILNPMLKINQLARTIAGGQYGARLDVEFDDEVGELCKTLNNMSVELARMEKLKNDFISSVSHELRTPLTAINGWAETVEHDLGDPAIASAGLAVIKNETARLSQMVEEMLDFSRIESGALRLHSEEMDVRGQLYDAVFMYTDMLKSQSLAVRYEEPEEPVMISGDKNRLKQVFLNIIDNAAKYGGGGERVEVTIEAEDEWCHITIRDHGQGIPENELPFVKEKFFKGSARGRGTGIGLAVCDEIILMHGGNLDVESMVGTGTAVHITLPLLPDPETE